MVLLCVLNFSFSDLHQTWETIARKHTKREVAVIYFIIYIYIYKIMYNMEGNKKHSSILPCGSHLKAGADCKQSRPRLRR